MAIASTTSIGSAINSYDLAAAVTLDDAGAIPLTRAICIYHNNTGTVKVRMSNGDDVTFSFPSGIVILPIRVTRVWVTGTTVSLNVIALY